MAFFACLPFVLFASFLSVNDVTVRQRAIGESAQAIATGIRLTLDGEVAATIAGLKVLSASSNLGRAGRADNLAAFYAEAVEFLRGHGTNILLIEPDGSQVFNTRRPLGAVLPKTNAPEVLARVIATGQPVVTDVFVGAVLQEPLVAIEVPVIRDGHVRWSLCLNLLTGDIQQLVARARRPDGWGLAVLDSHGRFVARSRKVAAGEMARPGLPEAIAASPQGTVDTVTREGIPVSNIFLRSEMAPWTVVVGVPKADLAWPVMRMALGLGAAALAALVAAGILAAFFGRRIVAAVGRLAAEDGAQVASGILEIDAVAKRLRQVQDGLRESEGHHRDLARRADALRLEAEQANRSKSRFLAAASHDMRQPTQALILLHGVLAGQNRDAQQSDIIANIGRTLESQQGMLDTLLRISQLDAGIVDIRKTDLEIMPLLQRVVEEFSIPAAEKGLSLRVVPSSAVVHTDAAQMERIVRNLVNNAVKYTNTGGILLGGRISGAKFRLQVWDTGPGIPADQCAMIFEEFVQLGNPERDRRKGLGLGLSIVDRLVRLLDHQLEIRSVVGKGTMFEIVLPLVGWAGTVAADRVSYPQVPSRLGLIVVIEDDRSVLEALKLSLRSVGYTVLAGTSLGEVLELVLAAATTPEAVVSDYRLGDGQTGIEAIQAIQAACGRPIAGILLTGDTAPERLAEAKNSDFVLLHKPVSIDELVTTIDQLLTRTLKTG